MLIDVLILLCGQTIDPSKDFVKEIKIARGSDGKFQLPELDF
jgi:hypothetical protein